MLLVPPSIRLLDNAAFRYGHDPLCRDHRRQRFNFRLQPRSVGVKGSVLRPLSESHLTSVVCCVSSFRGSPFITEVGVGKLIKGWDEGKSRNIFFRVTPCRSADGRRYGRSGVLQLTRGSRAILKVSPDYVRVVHAIDSLSDIHLPFFRRTALGVSHH